MTDGILEGYPGIRQCSNCGIFDHADAQCGEHSNSPKPSDEIAYNRWAEVGSAGVAAHTVALEDDRVLMLHPAEPPAFYTPLTITCGAKQVQTCLEPTTFDPQGRTLISIHLMLAAEQLRRPTLTLAKLWVELSLLYRRVELPRPNEWYVPGDSETLTTYSPVPICATMDGVDVTFEACVVVDVFPPGICLGPQELKCYNINHQDSTGEARIDERASLVSFVVPHAAPIPLRGLVDTGSGVSILTFSAFNGVAARTGTVLKPYQIDLYGANGKTIKTFGLAEQIRFQLGGYELETNFVVVDDAMHTVHGIKDLLLAQNRDVHVLVLKKLVNGETIDQDIFPEDVRAFAGNYFKQKKELLFLNSNSVLCVKYPLAQRPLHERPCMIVMPQLYQHEILFRAHDAMGHQGIGKVVARIQERHTWPGIRRTVGEYVSQCLTCQQVRDKPGDVRFHLKNFQSGYFMSWSSTII